MATCALTAAIGCGTRGRLYGGGTRGGAHRQPGRQFYGAKLLISETTRAELAGHARLREIDRLRVQAKQASMAINEAMDHLTVGPPRRPPARVGPARRRGLTSSLAPGYGTGSPSGPQRMPSLL